MDAGRKDREIHGVEVRRTDEERDVEPDARKPVEHDAGSAGRTAEPLDPETARRPVPGVKHEPEPDAGNIMPAENEPGTL